jgi:hypothetical protein
MRITKLNVLDTLAIAIALLWFVYVRVVGNLYISELLLFVIFMVIFKRNGHLLFEPLPKRILFFGFLWLFSQILTDLVRLTAFESMLKGWGSIVFFLVGFSALYMLISGNSRRLKLFIIAFALGGLLQCLIEPGYGFEEEPWKFGYGFSVLLLVIFVVVWGIEKRILIPWLGEVILLMMGGLSIYLNGRALGGAMILAVLLFRFSKVRLFQQMFLVRSNLIKKIGLFFAVTGAVFLVLVSYQWAGESQILPEKAQYKYEFNKSSSLGPLGLILGGRSEMIASIPAVIDSPIIGHGSWAEGPKYRAYMYEIEAIFGVDKKSEDRLKGFVESKDSIPAHSHLMQSWVWAGLLGAIFWVVVLKIIVDSAIVSMRLPRAWSILILFVSVKAVWDILFSPFSSEMRLLWDWELILLLTVLTKQKKKSQSD